MPAVHRFLASSDAGRAVFVPKLTDASRTTLFKRPNHYAAPLLWFIQRVRVCVLRAAGGARPLHLGLRHDVRNVRRVRGARVVWTPAWRPLLGGPSLHRFALRDDRLLAAALDFHGKLSAAIETLEEAS